MWTEDQQFPRNPPGLQSQPGTAETSSLWTEQLPGSQPYLHETAIAAVLRLHSLSQPNKSIYIDIDISSRFCSFREP